MKHRALLRKLYTAFLIGTVCAAEVFSFSANADDITDTAAAGWQAEVWCGEELTARTLSAEDAWLQAVKASRARGKEEPVTVKLLRNWTVSGSFPGSISEQGAVNVQNCNLVLDLNGHIMSRGLIKEQDNGQLFTVKGDAVLTVCDSDPAASNYGYGMHGGILTGGHSDDYSGCVEIQSGGTFNFNGGSIVSCHSDKAGAAVRMADGGTLNVNGGSFYFNSETYDGGGAVFCRNGKVNLKNAVFEGNYTKDEGGALYLENARLTASDCVFRGNKAEDHGGVIYITGSSSTADLDGCIFTDNSSGEDGGAVYVNKCSSVFFRNSLFEGNYADDTGGALHADYDNTVLDSVTVIGNTADQGGGVYVFAQKDIAVQGRVIIRDNHDKNGRDNNVVLQWHTVTIKAYINNGGLYEGSEIHVKSSASGTTRIGKNISLSQQQYFVADDGRLRMDKLEKRSEKFISSVIGEGNIAVILLGLTGMLLIVTGLYFFRKRTRRQQEKQEVSVN